MGRLPFWEGFEASIKTALSKLPLVKPLRRVNEHYVQHMRMHLLYVCMHIYIYIICLYVCAYVYIYTYIYILLFLLPELEKPRRFGFGNPWPLTTERHSTPEGSFSSVSAFAYWLVYLVPNSD